jgi:hypothetical protein
LAGTGSAASTRTGTNTRYTNACAKSAGKHWKKLVVFAMRPVDLKRMLSPEPAMHPWCALHAARACPMLVAGRMGHYRSTPVSASLADFGAVSNDTSDAGRAGAPADRWSLVWANHYKPMIDPAAKQWAALVTPDWIVRTRPIGGSA